MIKQKVCMITLGCKVNTYESDAIAGYLIKNGYNVVSNLERADIYVLSTCAVTNLAERKSRGYISKILKLNSEAEIYVCGCASEHNSSQFLKCPNVKYVLGTNDKLRLAKIICGQIHDENKSYKLQEKVYNDEYRALSLRTRAVIKIQDGCNNFCSYCLIPYLRGRERSRSLLSIKREIETLSASAKEIVLTGINMSAYGKDFENQNLSLIDVCELFAGTNIKFRISSLEVNVITPEFLNRLAKLPEFQPHFHLSLQSGSDNTLKKMNRKYTSLEFQSKVDLIRSIFPAAGITTDVIVGFPTETNEDFEVSYSTCEKIGFSWIHVFPYSKRDGTLAAKEKSVASGDEINNRAKRLGNLAFALREKFTSQNIGKTFEVITEQEKNGYVTGHTGNFIKCYIKQNGNVKINEVVKVKIDDVYLDGAIASLV